MPDWIEIVLRTFLAVVVLFFMTKLLGNDKFLNFPCSSTLLVLRLAVLRHTYHWIWSLQLVSWFDILSRLDCMLFRD